MADSIITNDINREKLKDNELIYYSTLMCDLLDELESLFKKSFPDNPKINLLLAIKQKWIDTFNSNQINLD